MIKQLCMLSLLAVAALVANVAVASAQVSTVGKLETVRTGWNADTFAVYPDTGILNPAGCSDLDGYIYDKSMPGYDTFYTASLLAFEHQYNVEVVVDSTRCYAGRPVMIGINLLR